MSWYNVPSICTWYRYPAQRAQIQDVISVEPLSGQLYLISRPFPGWLLSTPASWPLVAAGGGGQAPSGLVSWEAAQRME